jgi:hypothetical protein
VTGHTGEEKAPLRLQANTPIRRKRLVKTQPGDAMRCQFPALRRFQNPALCARAIDRDFFKRAKFRHSAKEAHHRCHAIEIIPA